MVNVKIKSLIIHNEVNLPLQFYNTLHTASFTRHVQSQLLYVVCLSLF